MTSTLLCRKRINDRTHEVSLLYLNPEHPGVTCEVTCRPMGQTHPRVVASFLRAIARELEQAAIDHHV